MESGKREPLKEAEDNNRKVEVYAELAESTPSEIEGSTMQALALAYARYLVENDMKPGDLTFVEPDELPDEADEAAEAVETDETVETVENADTAADGDADDSEPEGEADDSEPAGEAEPESSEEESEETEKEEEKPAALRKATERLSKEARALTRADISDEEAAEIGKALAEKSGLTAVGAGTVDLLDKLQEKIVGGLTEFSMDFVSMGHNITTSYRQSRKIIGAAILTIGVIAAILLALFDKYTVYEYAYNGRILGYVKNQEDVTDILDIASHELTENRSGENAEIRFVANQNVTFNLVDGRGKSIDDSDTAVNKLVYMTDIETEGFGIYDGDSLKAVVKSNDEAELLLNATREELSTPDKGMELVSSEFTNDLAIRPVNVLLTSVQSYEDAREIMINGGSVEFYHIVEADETLTSLARKFGIDPINIFDEDNENVVTEIEQGDTVCIHEDVEPVSVKMVETGKMKEVIEFETIKKESKDYYKGDIHIQQEGKDTIQIFEGTVTKVGGEVTKRDEVSITPVQKGQDKIILVGTAERPKTAPTGTYIVPLRNYEGISSNFGYRWGRLHSGIDMGASRGTPIYATDGGYVQRAGWYAGYGLCVEIDHGNGRMTRYGHCSALLVNQGDLVYQGQNIALVGNTGHSFGNHLHFEINLNGRPVNPRPYLGI